MKYTENLGLNLPENSDLANVSDYNDNFKTIDDEYAAYLEEITDIYIAMSKLETDKPTVHEGNLLTPYDLAMGSYSSTEELFKVGDIYINIDDYKIYQIVNVISSTDSYTYLYKILTQDIDQSYNPNSSNAQSGKAVAEAIGNIETVLDGIITIQNELIGGDSV